MPDAAVVYPEVTVTLWDHTILRLNSSGEIVALWGKVPEGIGPSALLFADEIPEAARPKYILPIRRVTFPLFDVADNPTIRLSEVRARRFDMIDRAMPFEPSWVRAPLSLPACQQALLSVLKQAPPTVWELLLDDDDLV